MILRFPEPLLIAGPEGDVSWSQIGTAWMERDRGSLVFFLKNHCSKKVFQPCSGERILTSRMGSSFSMAPSVTGFFLFLRLPAKVPISSNCDGDF